VSRRPFRPWRLWTLWSVFKDGTVLTCDVKMSVLENGQR
jgi:hypothetical protein